MFIIRFEQFNVESHLVLRVSDAVELRLMSLLPVVADVSVEVIVFVLNLIVVICSLLECFV